MPDPKVDRGTVDASPVGLFIPAVDSQLTIDLPGERTRATVRRIVDPNTVLVELTTMPMGKSHQYRFKDMVAVRRNRPVDMWAPGSPDSWAVVEERITLPSDIPSAPPTQRGLVQQEKVHAVVPGLEPRGDRAQHKRDGSKRPPKSPSNRRESQQRPTPPKLPRRPGSARGR